MFFRRRRNPEEDDIIEGEIEDISEGEDSEEAAPAAPPAPRQRRFFRRQSTASPAQPLTPDRPLERVAPDVPTPLEAGLTVYEGAESDSPAPSRWRWPRLLAWGEVRPEILTIAISLIVGGIFWTLHNRGETSQTLEIWWPLAILLLGLGWALWSLIQRRPTPFLAAMALTGIGISVLLDTQDYLKWHETLIGIALMTLGVGIMARGLLLRQGSVVQ